MPAYRAGEVVVQKGALLNDFYRVCRGRFAILASPEGRASSSLDSQGQVKMVLEDSNQTFGEVEAMLGYPQSYSVVALTPAEATIIPARQFEAYERYILEAPPMGLNICVAFARRLKACLDMFFHYTSTIKNIDQVIQSSCRNYLGVVKEVSAQPAGVLELLPENTLKKANEHELFAFATDLEKGSASSKKAGGTIGNCIVRPPASPEKVISYPAGTCICKKGTLGNRLFILTEGEVEVVLSPTSSIKINEPGTVIGEIAILLNLAAKIPDQQRTADVVSTTPIKVFSLGLEEIFDYSTKHPDLVTTMVQAMAERTKSTINLITENRELLREKLFKELAICLKGHNQLAHDLAKVKDNFNLSHALGVAIKESRAAFDRFASAKLLLEVEEGIPV